MLLLTEDMAMRASDLIPWSRGRGLRHRGYEGHPLESLHREMERMMDEMWRGAGWPAFASLTTRGGILAPRIDVAEDDTEIRVTAELPGVNEDDVEVTLGDNALTLKGEKKETHEESEGGYRHAERWFGAFHRTIPLDCEVVREKVKATFEKGVLTVVLPKTPETESKDKRIPVTGSGKAEDKPKKAA